MALDNFTPRKVRALEVCPGGQLPGDVFEVTEDAANVLVSVGAVEFVDELVEVKAEKGKYKRRDLRAEP